MTTENEFVSGLIVKAPNDNAPEYVKARLSMRREELIAWLQSRTGEWVNADVKVSQGGKWYAAVDNWKPKEGGSQRQERPASRPGGGGSTPSDDPFASDSIPFITCFGKF